MLFYVSMLGIYLFDKQNLSIFAVFGFPHVVTFSLCQGLDFLNALLSFFFSFFKLNAVPDELGAVNSHATLWHGL